MSKFGNWEYQILSLIFNNTAPTVDVSAAGGTDYSNSSTVGSLFIALFTADPLENESNVAAECNYTGYSRVAVARTSGGWTVSSPNGTAKNTAAITFGTCTAGTETATYFGICKAGIRATADIIYIGQLTASLGISSGVTPQFVANSLIVTED